MKPILFALLLGVSFSQVSVACTGSRNKPCTKEKILVCATLFKGLPVTKSNKCVACSDSNVKSYTSGACPTIPTPSFPIINAPPPTPPASNKFIPCALPRQQVCPFIYDQVCGVSQSGQKKTYDSSCIACAYSRVTGYSKGACIEERPTNPSAPKPLLKNCGVPQIKQINCGFLYYPVCGQDVSGKIARYDNVCLACKNYSLAGYYDYDGSCS